MKIAVRGFLFTDYSPYARHDSASGETSPSGP
jgi:hypothetical protein